MVMMATTMAKDCHGADTRRLAEVLAVEADVVDIGATIDMMTMPLRRALQSPQRVAESGGVDIASVVEVRVVQGIAGRIGQSTSMTVTAPLGISCTMVPIVTLPVLSVLLDFDQVQGGHSALGSMSLEHGRRRRRTQTPGVAPLVQHLLY